METLNGAVEFDRCNDCNCKFDPQAPEISPSFDGASRCEDCALEYHECEDCGYTEHEDDMYCTDDGMVCEDCFSDNYTDCLRCDTTVHNEMARKLGDNWYCANCADDEMTPICK